MSKDGPFAPADRISTLPGKGQAGAGMLGTIALLGLVFALVQGTLFYRSKSSARFIASEKNKIMAQQVAEAGVEENIADLGSRKLRPLAGMSDYATYTDKAVGSGTFTSRLTTLAVSPEADTLELSSLGRVSSAKQSVSARLRIKRYLDTLLTPIMEVTPETTITTRVATWPETTSVVTVQDPMTMPALDATAAYDACMASSDRNCDICHIPRGNIDNRRVIPVDKHSFGPHLGDHGDYVTTDGTCDIYNPRLVQTVVLRSGMVLDTTYVDRTVYDTLVVVDTLAKVQILSWK